MEKQAELAALAALAKIQLPSSAAMLRDIDKSRQFVERRYPASPRYGLEIDGRRYPREIDAVIRDGLKAVRS
jgi:hypothetical protein